MRPIGFALALALALPLGAAGCIGDYSSEAGAPAIAPPPIDAIEETSRWLGSWSSPSCGDREFERVIKLQEEGEFRAEDRVAPCPAGSYCMWSGIVLWSGTWELDGDRAILTEVNPPAGPVDAPRPRELEWNEYTHGPAERSPEGDLCAYDAVNPPTPPVQPVSD
jgi:hypothetical protein